MQFVDIGSVNLLDGIHHVRLVQDCMFRDDYGVDTASPGDGSGGLRIIREDLGSEEGRGRGSQN